MTKEIILIFLLFLISLFQFSLLKGFLGFNLQLIFLLLILFNIYSYQKKLLRWLTIFLIGGVLYDIHSEDFFFGFYAIIFIFLGLAIFYLSRNIDIDRLFGRILFAFNVVFLFYVFFAVVEVLVWKMSFLYATSEFLINLLIFEVIFLVCFSKKISIFQEAIKR